MGKGYKKKRNKAKLREHKPRPDVVNFISSIVERGNFNMEYVFKKHLRLTDQSIY